MPAKAKIKASHRVMMRGVYACVDGNTVLYVGSSARPLSELAYNHRNAFRLRDSKGRPYSMTRFRTWMRDNPGIGKFGWLIEPFRCDQKTIETYEGMLINKYDTPAMLNDCKNPVAKSIACGRYN